MTKYIGVGVAERLKKEKKHICGCLSVCVCVCDEAKVVLAHAVKVYLRVNV
jgi:hypothetical protein